MLNHNARHIRQNSLCCNEKHIESTSHRSWTRFQIQQVNLIPSVLLLNQTSDIWKVLGPEWCLKSRYSHIGMWCQRWFSHMSINRVKHIGYHCHLGELSSQQPWISGKKQSIITSQQSIIVSYWKGQIHWMTQNLKISDLQPVAHRHLPSQADPRCSGLHEPP